MTSSPNQFFIAAIEVLGSQAAMARAVNKPPQLINQIKQGERQMPVAWAPLIEEATSMLGTPVLCEDLAPSVNWSYLRNAPAERVQQATEVAAA